MTLWETRGLAVLLRHQGSGISPSPSMARLAPATGSSRLSARDDGKSKKAKRDRRGPWSLPLASWSLLTVSLAHAFLSHLLAPPFLVSLSLSPSHRCLSLVSHSNSKENSTVCSHSLTHPLSHTLSSLLSSCGGRCLVVRFGHNTLPAQRRGIGDRDVLDAQPPRFLRFRILPRVLDGLPGPGWDRQVFRAGV